ncbi:hypothetical protein OG417_07720 [Actinoallomurus sp. NBC_01490]|nr:hypothetical protein [Actinoallomurus sp. NBC_01490]
MSGAAAFALFGPVHGDERRERVRRLVVVYACGCVVGVDVEPREDRLVEGPASSFAGEPVELVGPFEQFQDGTEGVGAGLQVGAVRLFDLVLQSGAFVADLAEAFGDLVFGPVGIADQVEVLIFLAVELGDLLLDAVDEFGVGRGGGAECAIHTLVDTLAQVGGECHGGVVVGDGLFDVGHGHVGEVARVVLPAPADVVEVHVAAFALAAHDDQASFAAVTPDGALEVVVVRTGARAAAALAVEDFLDAVEERLID